MLPLTDKRALVCGSSQGIGLACAAALAQAGAEVILLARSETSLDDARRDLPTPADQQHAFICADFSDPTDLRERVAAYVAETGPLHILINNAGGPPAGPLLEATPDAFHQAVANHVVCNQLLVQSLAPGMKTLGYGRIINIISTSVITPIRGLGVSNTTRGAVANWARTLAGELGPYGITVNNILPGYTETARLRSLIQRKADLAKRTPEQIADQMRADIPVARFADPAEIGAVAVFLASPAASYVNGVNLPVDGGRTAWQ